VTSAARGCQAGRAVNRPQIRNERRDDVRGLTANSAGDAGLKKVNGMLTPGYGRTFEADGNMRGAATSSRVRVTANRQHIDNRFPVLGFTVDSGDLPYFEVLLTTDRSLFDPANAGKRTATNFYASRQDSGLIRADGQASVYLTPTTVLRSFAPASSIYYTAIAYASQDGRGPVFAHAPETLPTQAPAVSVSADFRGRTLAAVLSVPLEKLRRIRDDGAVPDYSAGFAAPEAEIDAVSDRAEGEDGYGRAAAQSWEGGDTDGGERAYADGGDDAYGLSQDTPYGRADDYDDLFDGPVGDASSYGDALGTAATGYGSEYADDAEPSAEEQFQASAQGVHLPEGAQAPTMLEDEEEYSRDDVDGDEFSGYAATYDDEMGFESAVMGTDDEPAYGTLDSSPTPSDPSTLAPTTTSPAAQALTIQAKKMLLDHVAPFESGRDLYAYVNGDGEFAGHFGTQHPAYQRYHIGLSYGKIPATQDSGNLGRLLAMMRDRDPQRFRQVFGPHADELVQVTNAPGPPSSASPQGRSARVQPIGGADLWSEAWVARFKEAAKHRSFQAAQNELAASIYLDPMLRFAGWLGLDTDRALTMVLDRSVQMGPRGAQRWIIEAVGPVQTPAQRQQALAALGYADIPAFQHATPALERDGDWGPQTHAAMVAALRQLGSRAPLPIPTREQMLDAMVRRAVSTPWAHRVAQLRSSPNLSDVVFQI
jgi:hypothetical protein